MSNEMDVLYGVVKRRFLEDTHKFSCEDDDYMEMYYKGRIQAFASVMKSIDEIGGRE